MGGGGLVCQRCSVWCSAIVPLDAKPGFLRDEVFSLVFNLSTGRAVARF